MSDVNEEFQEAIDEGRWEYAIRLALNSGHDVFITIDPTDDGSKGTIVIVEEND